MVVDHYDKRKYFKLFFLFLNMDVFEAVTKKRTIRSFLSKKIKRDVLKKCVESGRLSSCGSNLQALEYVIIDEKTKLEEVFDCLKWAGFVEWCPTKKEMPQAYILVLGNKDIRKDIKYDVGISCEAMTLTAFSLGLGSCILGSIDREKLKRILKIPQGYDIELIIALGYSNQKSQVEEYKGSIKYWIDENKNFHVPKKPLKDILHVNKF